MSGFVIIFFCIFAYLIFTNIKTFIENENSPVLTEYAHLVKKRRHTHADANGTHNTTLILVFDINGEVIKCVVPRRVYRAVRENTSGRLTHQGTRFKAFEFEGIRVEK